MGRYAEIYCLNKRHSKIVCEFLSDLERIVSDATYYDDDFEGFKEVMNKFISYHNELGVYAVLGSVEYDNWYMSLPNNVYWATLGYFASVQAEGDDDLSVFKLKVLSLISKTMDRLDRSLISQSWTETEEKIHLN